MSELQSRLSSAGVHPIFLLTDSSLEDEYRALVGEMGFGAVVAVNLTDAIASSYNDNYLPQAMADGLEVIDNIITRRSTAAFYFAKKISVTIGTRSSSWCQRSKGPTFCQA